MTHVVPLKLTPQRPSVLGRPTVGVGVGAPDVVDGHVDGPDVPVRYQLPLGSPRHSPTVTERKPLRKSDSSMYPVRL